MSSVEGNVLQMCPLFNQLNGIFGAKRTAALSFEVFDTGDTAIMDESATDQILEETFCDVEEENQYSIDLVNDESQPSGNVKLQLQCNMPITVILTMTTIISVSVDKSTATHR
ncbi:uncharacterized protein LOC128920421 [Zeugodacus cucurbitae]|uniref:uncharacterized protein LOC128920421 n=1 Tax=Zeugodacus cucurbitae TaxID=28588 RepID=UPI0023D92F86|nr:uncharacterized protein LOC128920421 [Zeugodacus cucurbitae]